MTEQTNPANAAGGRFTLSTLADYIQIEETPYEERMPHASVYGALAAAEQRFSDRVAVSFQLKGDPKAKGFDFSYGEYMGQVRRAANLLHALGASQEKPVALLLPNLPETLFATMGGVTAGVIAPINPLLEPEQIASILRESGATTLITLAPFPKIDIYQRAEEAVAMAPNVETVVEIDLKQYLSPPLSWLIPLLRPKRKGYAAKRVNYAEAAAKANDKALDFTPIEDQDRIAAYFHTGGTTGDPKLAQHAVRGMLFQAWVASACVYDEGDVVMCALPLFHVFGAYAMAMAAPQVGGRLVMMTPAGFRGEGVIDNFWKLTERYKANFLISVPTAISALNQRPIDADVSSLRFTVSGSAPLPRELFRDFEQKTGLKILEGFGQTEATCVCSCNPPDGERRVGSVGFALPYTRMTAAEIDEAGAWVKGCAVDEIGEILVRGPHVFPGYKQAERNKKVFVDDPDGFRWLRTGDLGRVDADGYFWITGRAKDLIIRGGHNIDPGMIEETAAAHPAVAFSGAIGQPDARVGELPCLYVELNEGAEADPEAIKAFVSERVSERAARPVHVEVMDELPKTAVGKVFKPDLRKRATERVFKAALAGAGIEAEVACVKDSTHGLVAEVTPTDGSSEARLGEVLNQFPGVWRMG